MEKPSGPYPTLVTQPDTERVVPVIQAYAYTKYLGFFKMKFDDNGEMIEWEGAPRLLNESYKQDPIVLKELEPWKAEINTFGKNIKIIQIKIL